MSRKSLYEIIKNANDKDKLADRFLNDFVYTIETLDEHEQKKPSKAFHPSNLNCDRSSVLEVMGAAIDGNKKTHNLISICRNGTSTHLMVQEYVSKMADLGLNWVFEDVAKYVAENNIPLKIASNMNIDDGVYETKIVSEEYNIRGLCDGLLSYKDKDGNKKYVLLEIKTINSRQYYQMKDILPKHRVQAVSYCSLLQVDAVIFLYVERDLLNKKTFYQLALTWGANPIMNEYKNSTDELFASTIEKAVKCGIVKKGDTLVITAGAPGDDSVTNLLKALIIE